MASAAIIGKAVRNLFRDGPKFFSKDRKKS